MLIISSSLIRSCCLICSIMLSFWFNWFPNWLTWNSSFCIWDLSSLIKLSSESSYFLNFWASWDNLMISGLCQIAWNTSSCSWYLVSFAWDSSSFCSVKVSFNSYSFLKISYFLFQVTFWSEHTDWSSWFLSNRVLFFSSCSWQALSNSWIRD